MNKIKTLVALFSFTILYGPSQEQEELEAAQKEFCKHNDYLVQNKDKLPKCLQAHIDITSELIKATQELYAERLRILQESVEHCFPQERRKKALVAGLNQYHSMRISDAEFQKETSLLKEVIDKYTQDKERYFLEMSGEFQATKRNLEDYLDKIHMNKERPKLAQIIKGYMAKTDSFIRALDESHLREMQKSKPRQTQAFSIDLIESTTPEEVFLCKAEVMADDILKNEFL